MVTSSEVAVRAQEVSVSFAGEFALKPTSILVAKGEATVVRGASGAGKSTLLRALVGLLEPTDGTVELWPDSGGAQGKSIGLTLEEPRLWPWMRADKAVMCTAGLSGVSIDRAGARELLDELRLSDAAATKVSKLSQGMRRRVQVAGALAIGRDLLILDEPTASLDADNAAVVWAAIERRRAEGTPVIVASHDDIATDSLKATSLELS